MGSTIEKKSSMEKFSDHQKGLVAILLTALLWSSGGLLVKLISLSAMQLSFFRCIIAALVFAAIFKKQVFYLNGLAVVNAIFYATVLVLFVYSTKSTTAANAIFLQSTAPIYVFLIEPLLNKTKYEKINIITVIICSLGMVLFFVDEITPGQMNGNIAGLGAGLAFAAMFIGLRVNKKEFQLSSIFYGNMLVAVFTFQFLFDIEQLLVSDLLMVSFLGIFQIGIAYAIFSYGLHRVQAFEASVMSLLEPLLNPIWVFIGYNERPSFNALLGGGIILSAILLRTVFVEIWEKKKVKRD